MNNERVCKKKRTGKAEKHEAMGAGAAVRRLRRRNDNRACLDVDGCGGGVGMKWWDALTYEGKTAVGAVVLLLEAWLLWG